MRSVVDNKDELSLVAVCDNSKDSIDRFLKSNDLMNSKLREYTEISDVLGDLREGYYRLRFVIIGTPSGLHVEHACEFAKIGVHCLIENHGAPSRLDLPKLSNIAKQSGSKISVIHQNRYNSTVQWLKEHISTGKLGQIYYMNANVVWNRNQEYYDQDYGTVQQNMTEGYYLTKGYII